MEIGLPVPREPVRIVGRDGTGHLVRPSSGRDLTDVRTRFVDVFLDGLPEGEGLILKNRSPTSALRDVKIYPSASPYERGAGFFGRAVLERYPNYPEEDEGRLRNLQDPFFTRIYTPTSELLRLLGGWRD